MMIEAKIRQGSRVVCMAMPRTYANQLKVGQEYVVARMLNEGEWLEVVGSEAQYETKYFRLVEVSRQTLFLIALQNGHTYRVRCTEEAVKELAEIIGDDHLESIGPVYPRKKNGTAQVPNKTKS
jgi:hypothetical protein